MVQTVVIRASKATYRSNITKVRAITSWWLPVILEAMQLPNGCSRADRSDVSSPRSPIGDPRLRR